MSPAASEGGIARELRRGTLATRRPRPKRQYFGLSVGWRALNRMPMVQAAKRRECKSRELSEFSSEGAFAGHRVGVEA